MSRRKVRPHATFGQLVLKCPHGHTVGAVLMSRHGDLYRLEHPLTDKIPTAEMLPLVTDEKLKVQCPACREAGRFPDYQASLSVVRERLEAQRADVRCEHAVLQLR